jgi:hypothetical protein
LEAQPVLRAQKLAGQTLGQLAGHLFESFVVPEGFERELLPEDKIPTDRISFTHSFRLPLPTEQREQTRVAIQELVALRNELVHHFLSRFDLWDEQGCADAIGYLQDAYQRIDTRFRELRAWMLTMHKARETMAAFMQSKVFLDLLVNGINPDGSFEWADTGIVRALRNEVRTLAGDNWIELQTVKAQMLARHPDQTPQKYRCTTLSQVLHESGEFEVTHRRDADTGPKTAWVRLRPVSAPPSGAKERKRPGRGAVTSPADPAPEPG